MRGSLAQEVWGREKPALVFPGKSCGRWGSALGVAKEQFDAPPAVLRANLPVPLLGSVTSTKSLKKLRIR